MSQEKTDVFFVKRGGEQWRRTGDVEPMGSTNGGEKGSVQVVRFKGKPHTNFVFRTYEDMELVGIDASVVLTPNTQWRNADTLLDNLGVVSIRIGNIDLLQSNRPASYTLGAYLREFNKKETHIVIPGGGRGMPLEFIVCQIGEGEDGATGEDISLWMGARVRTVKRVVETA